MLMAAERGCGFFRWLALLMKFSEGVDDLDRTKENPLGR
jgi:hypothetical protein